MTASAHWGFWLAVGFAGQAAFSSRFLVQWITSERVKRSVIPLSFWWLSLCGGALLLAYALSQRDPVFIVGQTAGIVVYARNLVLLQRERGARDDQRLPGRRSFGA